MSRPRCQIVNEVPGLLADLFGHRICAAVIRRPQAELFFPIAIRVQTSRESHWALSVLTAGTHRWEETSRRNQISSTRFATASMLRDVVRVGRNAWGCGRP